MDSRVRSDPALSELWRLEPIGPGRYRGWSREGAPGRTFGGQVAAQALAAAGHSIDAHHWPVSLHAYFVREGRDTRPIAYDVDTVDGGGPGRWYCRVTATQDQRAILTLEAAFAPPVDPLPEPREDGPEPVAWTPAEGGEQRWLAERSDRVQFELRFATEPSTLAGREGRVVDGQQYWTRTGRRLTDDPLDHACALTYASDMFLVSTVMARHGLPGGRSVQAASIDHAVWFHRPVRLDEWVRYEQASPTSAGGRGLATGRLLDGTGALAATVRQEVLLRIA